MRSPSSRFRSSGASLGATWFHDCALNGPTDTLQGELCSDCGAVERLSRAMLRARLQCLEGSASNPGHD